MKRIIMIVSLALFCIATILGGVLLETMRKDLEGVKAAVQKGEDINETDPDHGSALVFALQKGVYDPAGYRDIAEYLINEGADPNIQNKDGFSPLHYAVQMEDLALVKALIERGAEINSYPDETKFYKGDTPLITACKMPYSEEQMAIVEYLVENGASIDQNEYDNRTALTNALFNKNNETILYLLEQGADPNNTILGGRTPLYIAISKEFPEEVIKALVDSGADVNQVYSHYTPLSIAAQKRRLDIMPFLIERGADYHYKDASGNSLLHKAASMNSQKVLNFFIDKGLDVNARNENGETPLHITAEKGYDQNVVILIQAGADLQAKDHNGYEPLHIHLFTQKGNQEWINYLLSKGIDVNSNNNEYRMAPIHIATSTGEFEIVKFLVGKGADVNLKAFNDQTPMHTAAISRIVDGELIAFLVSKGGNIEVEDLEGKTPLFVAFDRGNIDMMQVLLENGADINHRDAAGKTLVHYAAEDKWDGIEFIEFLHQNGADLKISDNAGHTPDHYAASDEIDDYLSSL